MTGILSFRPSEVAGYSQLYKNASANGDYGTLLTDRDANGNLAALKIDASRSYARFALGSTEHDILHTGNKPSGSYTGNGDATARTIDTGGIGSAIIIRSGAVSGGSVAIVSGGDMGGIIKSGETVTAVSGTEIGFSNGVLTITSINGALNKSGVTYYYQVL